MNKIYRLKFDRRRNQLVAVSELTTGAGKQKSTGRAASPAGIEGTGAWTLRPLLATLALAMLPGLALANPDLPMGGQIVAGQGGISTSGNQMTIQQQTQKLVTQWQSFDVGAQNTVRFVQPDSHSVALNRVMGASGSQILGSLQANGQVIILNPNGVLFGKDAQVNVAGLLASTKNLGNADFMAGRYDLSGGGADAQVINQGSLAAAPGGYIVLAGDQVKNSGSITAPAGKAVLAAADKVSLQLDNAGLVSVSVSGSVVNALVENTGLVAATNGQVYLTARGRDMLLNTVVNNSGTVEATGLDSHGGEIVLDGGDSGVTSQSGRLLADSATGQGGKITVEGRNIHLAATGKTSATGKTGGGQVYVGGGWQGKDGKIRNASKVVMDKAATIDVSATQGGNGGTAVLWSDDYTNFQGTILARGGAGAGNGGQVETSSHGNLQAFGDVDASAPAGQGGNWLLDPLDVSIVKGEVNTNVSPKPDAAASGQVFSPSASGAQVSATKIAEQLNAGTNVTVETRGVGAQPGTITFKRGAQIKKTTAGEATLTLKADKDIVFENQPWVDPSSPNIAVIATAGKLNVNLLTGNSGQDGNINIGAFVHFNLNGGDFNAGPASTAGGKTSMTFANNGSVTASNITLDTQGGVSGQFYSLIAGGNLTVKGPVAHSSGYNLPLLFKAGNLLDITAASGDIKFSADVVEGEGAGGKLVIDGRKGVNIQARNGHLVMNVRDRKQNAITVSSGEGAVNLVGKVQDGSNPLALNSVDISSAGDTKVDGLTGWGKATLLSDVTLNATGNIDIIGAAKFVGTDKLGAAASNGVTLTSSRLTAGGNVTMTGLSGSDPANLLPDNALTIWRSTLKAGESTGKIQLNGTTKSIVGVKMTGSVLSAASLEVNGVATEKGMGFSLENNQLQGGLADPKNVVLSSAGSFAGVTNLPVVSEPPPKPVEPPSGTGDTGKVPDSDADKGTGDADKKPEVGGGQGAGDADKKPEVGGGQGASDADKKPDADAGQGADDADKNPGADGGQGTGDADKKPDADGSQGTGDADKKPEVGGGQGAGDADKKPDADAGQGAGDADKNPGADGGQGTGDADKKPGVDGGQGTGDADKKPDVGGGQGAGDADKKPDADAGQGDADNNPGAGGGQGTGDSDKNPGADGGQGTGDADKKPGVDGGQGTGDADKKPDAGDGQGGGDADKKPDVGGGQVDGDADKKPDVGDGQGAGDADKKPDAGGGQGAGDADKKPDVGGGQGAGDADKKPDADGGQGAGDADKKPDVGGGQGAGDADKKPDVGGGQGGDDADKKPDVGGGQGAGDADKKPDVGGGQGAGDADKKPDAGDGQGGGDADKKPDVGGGQGAGDADKKPDADGGQGGGDADKKPDVGGGQGGGDADKEPDVGGGQGGGDADKKPDVGGGQGAGDADKKPDIGGGQGAGDADKKPEVGGGTGPEEDGGKKPEAPVVGELPGPFPQLTPAEVQVVRSAVAVTKGQSSANAQTSAQAQAPQSGFHVSGEPAVPASHYEVAAQGVDVNVCAGEECGSMKLDASKPSE